MRKRIGPLQGKPTVPSWRRSWARHPRWSLALRAAIAATVAWFVGVLAPPPFGEFPYYAPLGAVIATTGALARSIRDSAQAVGAVLLGVAIAWPVDLLPLPSPAAIFVVVAVSVLVSGWHRLGAMASWVVMSAIFVLVLGQSGDAGFPLAFVGLVLVGAAIGVGVNLLFPPLPLTRTDDALGRLREVLSANLRLVAERVETGEPATSGDGKHLGAVRSMRERARGAVAEVDEAARVNPRALHYRIWRNSQDYRARALLDTAGTVDQIVRLLMDRDAAERDEPAVGADVRSAVAAALRAYADAIDAVGDRVNPGLPTFVEITRDLRTILQASAGRLEGDPLVVAATVVLLERGVAGLRS